MQFSKGQEVDVQTSQALYNVDKAQSVSLVNEMSNAMQTSAYQVDRETSCAVPEVFDREAQCSSPETCTREM